jgi:hypothetical protein
MVGQFEGDDAESKTGDDGEGTEDEFKGLGSARASLISIYCYSYREKKDVKFEVEVEVEVFCALVVGADTYKRVWQAVVLPVPFLSGVEDDGQHSSHDLYGADGSIGDHDDALTDGCVSPGHLVRNVRGALRRSGTKK